MRTAHILAFTVVLLLFTLSLLLDKSPPGATEARATSSDTDSQETSPTPAPAAVVRGALKHYRAARHARHQCAKAGWCLRRHVRLHVTARPARHEPAATWQRVGAIWAREARGLKLRLAAMRDDMRHPGGRSNGSRWLPLARWVGWPEAALPTLAAIIYRESSGRERAYNPAIGCSGLLQIWPGHVAGSDRWRLFQAEFNLKVGLGLYRHSGWAPWAL